ncbi:hypothetical protein [Wolbachia endosymbiont (group B) of Germaria angustata]
MYPFSRVAKQGRREKITKWVSSQCLTIFFFFWIPASRAGMTGL